ncbi:MAG: hypothetical protein ACK4S6_16250 [Roseateles asaccharophilus]|uniref:hypothetical protein n=1 Tax=Roseateles asaccharophilus TaxID=582607 RepID=UPI0039191487
MVKDPMTAFVGNIGAGLGKGLGDAIGGGGGPMISGGTTDARGFMDGSGWTVSTGRSRASGGTSGGTRQEAAGQGWQGLGAQQAGIHPMMALAMAGLFAMFILRAGK